MSQTVSPDNTKASAHTKSAMVLVVDDNPVNQKVLSGVLKSAGIAVVAVSSGLEALERAFKDKPDLVLLDIMMPDMDGYEVCRQLKRHVSTRDLPVIFLTVKAETADIVKGFESGGTDYVLKPFQSLELLARVRTHVELKRAREEIKTLRGIVPVCASCSSVRDEAGTWQSLEEYVRSHTEAEFSHGFCPPCLRKLYPEVADRVLEKVAGDHD